MKDQKSTGTPQSDRFNARSFDEPVFKFECLKPNLDALSSRSAASCRDGLGGFFSSLADRTQILALMNAVIATYLILQTASFAKLVDEANSWALAVQ